jgi:hypothetical protein
MFTKVEDKKKQRYRLPRLENAAVVTIYEDIDKSV